jgi:hypothetical protein
MPSGKSSGTDALRAQLAALAGVDPDSELANVSADILRHARWSLAHNGGHPNPAWSPTEQIAVAWVLDDRWWLSAMGYTPGEAARQVAGGMFFPPADMDAWLADLRTQMEG